MTIAIIVSALVIILLTSGTFFVSFALKRHEADFDFQFEKGAIAEKNYLKNQQHTKQWLEENPVQKWVCQTAEGLNLIASFFPNSDSNRYVILVHGYTSCKEGMLSKSVKIGRYVSLYR